MSDNQYDKQYSGRIDVYRICRLYDVSDPAIYHAIKKLLRFGDGNKDKTEEVSGALASLRRWLEMEEEDNDSTYSDAVKAGEEVESKADQYLNSLIDDLMRISQPKYQEFVYRVIHMDIKAPPSVRIDNTSGMKKWLSDIHGEIDKIKGVADKVMNQEYDDYIISLANDLMGISKKHYQSAFHEINEELVPSIPSMRDRNYKDLKEWASELEGDELTKVAQIIENHKIETF